MRKSPSTLPIIAFALSIYHFADSFIHSTRIVGKISPTGSDSIQRHFALQSYNEIDDIHQSHDASIPASLTCCKETEQWHGLCEDVDKVMEGLVSPAPESFGVLHAVISKINSERECLEENVPSNINANSLNDLKALHSFLVKPGYGIELYLNSNIFKWRLIKVTENNSGVIYPCDSIEEGEIELYHEHNALQLSRMALDHATKTPNDPQLLPKIDDIAHQAEKRLSLTMGSDLRGPTSSDTCFNFALAGVQNYQSLFQTLCCIGIQELKRTGHRASFKPKQMLHMVEKFAACDLDGQHAWELYSIAGFCLEKKAYNDASLIESLKDGSFGFHCNRPLLWLWRYSSRQKKVSLSEFISKSKKTDNIKWDDFFHDTSKPLVVDVGSGMGVSLLNLAALTSGDDSYLGSDSLQMTWSDFNYAGADLNQALINFGNGILSRDTTTQRPGRVHFSCLSAEDFLTELQCYPGGLALIMINFPSPYRLEVGMSGNSQLPSKYSNQFMVSKNVLTLVADLMFSSSALERGRESLFLFQTKCEDVAVHVKNECLSLDTMECIHFNHSIEDIDLIYQEMGKRPKRVDEWLKESPVGRAEGSMYSSTPLLPTAGRPETEVQCSLEKTLVHRCLFRTR